MVQRKVFLLTKNISKTKKLVTAEYCKLVKLPDAEIFITALNNEKPYVYDRQTGLFTKGEQDLETLARQAAEEEIYQAALDDGILDQAAVNGEVYLSKLFTALGFENVIFE